MTLLMLKVVIDTRIFWKIVNFSLPKKATNNSKINLVEH